MNRMRLRDVHGPLATSTFAGVLGAGVIDAAVTLARGGAGAGLGVVELALGLYGAAGLLLAVLVGLFLGGVVAAIPGGAVALRSDGERDAAVTTGLLAGALGVAVAAAVSAAGQRLLIGQMQSQKLATIAAAGMVAIAALPASVVALFRMAVLAFSKARPNSSYDGNVIPLFAPAQPTWYTAPELNTAIKAGLTPFVGFTDSSGTIVEDRAKCSQMVTSKTTIGSTADDRVRDLAIPRTAVALAFQLNAAVDVIRTENPDGISQRDAQRLYKNLAAGIWRAEARARPAVLNPDFVERDIAAFILEPDDDVLGRVNGRLPSTPDIPNHQAAFYHDVQIGA